MTVDYQSKGSGAGIQDFINNTVDFAASDAAMKDEEIAKVKQGVVLLPMTAGEIVLSYNLEGVKELKLPRDVYIDIFMGKIAKWNDPKIAAANPGVKFPDQNITVVARSDSSGTTYVFTGHLSAVSEAFKSNRRSRHDRAVADQLREGAEKRRRHRHHQANSRRHRLHRVQLRHRHQAAHGHPAKQGRQIRLLPATRPARPRWPAPSFPPKRCRVPMRPTCASGCPIRPASKAYPIATFTWMLFYKDQDDAKAKVLRDLVEYGLTKGQAMAPKMGYIPLPENVIEQVRKASALIQ